jgi:hypothetical protein
MKKPLIVAGVIASLCGGVYEARGAHIREQGHEKKVERAAADRHFRSEEGFLERFNNPQNNRFNVQQEPGSSDIK